MHTLKTDAVQKTGSRSYFETNFNDYFTDLDVNKPYQNKDCLSSELETFLEDVAILAKAQGIAFYDGDLRKVMADTAHVPRKIGLM